MSNTKIDMDDSIDIQQVLNIVRRWLWLFALLAVIGAAVAYGVSKTQTPVYEAKTNILVSRNSQQQVADISQSLNFSQLIETYSQMLSMSEFLDIVAQNTSYEISADNVFVKPLPNTQIIELRVQDTDPERAAKIADAMVITLIERNESLQSGRYADAENSLNNQIDNIEAKILDVQTRLDEAKNNALTEQVAEVQSNIDATVKIINDTTIDLERLNKELTWESARFRLRSVTVALPGLQLAYDRAIANKFDLELKLNTDPQITSDQQKVDAVQGQINDLAERIADLQKQIEDTQKEIDFLTPITTEDGFNETLSEKSNYLATQKSLLNSYQNVYTALLSTEEVKRSTNEIDNLKKDLDLYQNIYINLLKSIENVKTERLQNTPSVKQVSSSVVSQYPVKPRTKLNTGLGLLAGLILAGLIVLVIESLDNTLKNREEAEKLFGVEVIGYIVEMKDENEQPGIHVARLPRSPVAEAFRGLRTNLDFLAKEKPIKSILVTSSAPSEGKTTVAANLAAILAHSGKKVILLDADLRRPRIHRYAGISNQSGLSDVLSLDSNEGYQKYLQKLESTPGLDVLSSGKLPANPVELLDSDNMRQLLDALSNTYNYIIIDSPPLLVSDPQVLTSLVDGVLLVMVPGKTRVNIMHAVHDQIERSGVRLLGVVFNRLRQGRHPSGYSGYGYYDYPYYYSSDYYASSDDEGEEKNVRKKVTKKFFDKKKD